MVKDFAIYGGVCAESVSQSFPSKTLQVTLSPRAAGEILPSDTFAKAKPVFPSSSLAVHVRCVGVLGQCACISMCVKVEQNVGRSLENMIYKLNFDNILFGHVMNMSTSFSQNGGTLEAPWKRHVGCCVHCCPSCRTQPSAVVVHDVSFPPVGLPTLRHFTSPKPVRPQSQRKTERCHPQSLVSDKRNVNGAGGQVRVPERDPHRDGINTRSRCDICPSICIA